MKFSAFKKSISIFLLGILLYGCSHDRILRVRQLSVPVDISNASSVSGEFIGLDAMLTQSPTKAINILYVHGIGWTQQSGGAEFGYDLLDSIRNHYSLSKERIIRESSCISEDSTGLKIIYRPGVGADGKNGVNGLGPFYTDDKYFKVYSDDLGCMDKATVYLDSDRKIYVYRYFWDNAFYENIEWVHFGYDDQLFGRNELNYDRYPNARYEYNKIFKDDGVSYGLGDAALYMGESGALIREGLKGAICSVVKGADEKFGNGAILSVDSLCQKLSSPSQTPLLLMSHSLGSRMLFDVFATDLNQDFSDFLTTSISQDSLNVVFLANQIPLLALGRLRKSEPGKIRLKKDLKFIAFSELNDLLSYELVPYFEHMYFNRCKYRGRNYSRNYENCFSGVTHKDQEEFKAVMLKEKARQSIVNGLGFDVIDVRVVYTSKFFGVLPMANPLSAHTNYLGHESVRRPFFCGIKNGKVLNC